MEDNDSSDENPYASSSSEYDPSSQEECETASSDSNDEEEVHTDKNTQLHKAGAKVTKINPRKKSTSQYIIKTDDYFLNHSNKKILTSNHTLDKLDTPRLPQDELQKLLKQTKISEEHRKMMKNLKEANELQFQKWLHLLYENFNVLLYGLGSKRKLLEQFQKEYLQNVPVIVVNGFFPSISIKDILDSILLNILEAKEGGSGLFEACEIVEQKFNIYSDLHLFIIIHNIEGDMLRNNKCQNVLARLADIRNIHLIATIDHINAPLSKY